MVDARIARLAEKALASGLVRRGALVAAARRPGRARRFLAANGVLPERVHVDLPAGSFVMHPGDPVDLVAQRVWLEGPTAFERPLPDVLLALPYDGGVVVVGANSGYYAMTLARASGARVLAYEPFPPAYERLRSNLAASGLDDQVRARPVAVAAEPGRATLHVPRPHHDRWPLEGSASLDPTFKREHGQPVEVDVVRLDDEIREAVALLFVDAEGADLDVLDGAADVVRRDRPFVAVEVTDADVTRLGAFARRYDYRVARLASDGLVLQDEPRQPERAAAVEDSNTRRAYWNVVLLPSERVDDVRRSLAVRRLTCVDERF